MKKLQNNFTTPDQSKRLLELGVPADSADCYYSRMRHEKFENPRICYMPYFNHTCFHPKTFIYLPCWSVGRLIDIYMIATGLQWIDLCFPDDFTESIVKIFEGTKDFDFSKLEE